MADPLSLTEPVDLSFQRDLVEQPQYEADYADLLGSMSALALSPPFVSQGTEKESTLALETFKNNRAEAMNFLTPSDEANVRAQAAMVRAAETVSTFKGMVASGISQATEGELKLRSEELTAMQQGMFLDKFALEKSAIDTIERFGLFDTDGLELANLILKEPLATSVDDLRRTAEAGLAIRNAIEKVRGEQKDQSLALDILEGIARLVPFNKWTSVGHLLKSTFGKGSGTILTEASDNIFNMAHTLPPAELRVRLNEMTDNLRAHSGLIFGENKQLLIENLSGLLSTGEHERGLQNILDWVDVATVLPLGATARFTKAGVLNAARAKRLATTVTVDEHLASRSGDAVPGIRDAINNSLPDSAKGAATDLSSHAGISDEVTRTLAAHDALIEAAARYTSTRAKAMDSEDTARALDGIAKDLVERFGEPYIKNSKIDTTGQIPRVSVVLGGKEGGYATLASAKAAATRMGLRSTDEQTVKITEKADPANSRVLRIPSNIFQDGKDLRWYIRHDYDAPDGNYILASPQIAKAPTWLSMLTRGKLGSAAKFVDESTHGRAIQADFMESKLRDTFHQIVKDGWNPMTRSEQRRVTAVLERGNQEARWYEINDFIKNYTDMHDGKLPTQREILGYYTAKQMNDLDYALFNQNAYKTLVRDGWERGTVTIGGERLGSKFQNIKVRESLPGQFRGAFYDAEKKEVFSHKEVAVDDVNARIKKDSLVLVQLPETRVFDGQKANIVLVKKSSVTDRSPLSPTQVKYSQGGHRIYAGTFWVKQARIGSFKGSKNVYVLRPLTHIVAETRKEATDWANRMESVRLSWAEKGQKEISEFEAFARSQGIDPEDWYRWVKKEEIDVDSPFEVVTSEQNIPLRQTEAFKAHPELVDMTQELSPRISYLEDNGRLFYSQKGPAKKGPQDEIARLIDPMASINRGVDNAIRLAAYAEYRVKAVEGWINQYGHLLDTRGVSKAQAFWDSRDLMKNKAGNDKIWLAAKMSQDAIKRQLSRGSDYTRAWDAAMQAVGGWFEKQGVPGLAKTAYNAGSRDPVTALKGMTFSMKLGMFDPSQLLVQTQTMAAMAFLDPLNAPKFIWEGMWLRRLAHNHTEEFLNFAAKRSSMDPAEFKAMAREMNESGILNISGELVQLDHRSTILKKPGIALLKGIDDAGRWPFYEAERLNRLFAYRMGWNEMRKTKSLAEMGTADARAELARLTDKFTNNMVKSSAAAWQKGPLSIPTQFLSYQFRLLENILPQAMGGSRAFSTGEKLALAMSQVALYGAAGVPAGDWMVRKMIEAGAIPAEFASTNGKRKGDDLAAQTAYRALVGGFWDSMLYAMTGGELDVAPSKRVSVNKGIEDYVLKLFNANTWQDFSVFEFVSGATGSTAVDVTSDAIEGLRNVWLAATSEKGSFMGATEAAVVNLAENISSFSRAHKAYLAQRYGYLISQESGRAIVPVTPMEVFALALGITPRDAVTRDWMQFSIDDRKAEVKKIRKSVSEMRQEMWRAMRDGDTKTRDFKMQQMSLLLNSYPPQIRMEVLKGIAANRDLEVLIKDTQRNFGKYFNPSLLPRQGTGERQEQ